MKTKGPERITNISEPVKLSLEDFGWITAVFDTPLLTLIDDCLFTYKSAVELLELKYQEVVFIYDVYYTKIAKKDHFRYLEYNETTQKVRLLKSLPEHYGDRIECCYTAILSVHSLFSKYVYDEIKKVSTS